MPTEREMGGTVSDRHHHMTKLEDLRPNAAVRGILPDANV